MLGNSRSTVLEFEHWYWLAITSCPKACLSWFYVCPSSRLEKRFYLTDDKSFSWSVSTLKQTNKQKDGVARYRPVVVLLWRFSPPSRPPVISGHPDSLFPTLAVSHLAFSQYAFCHLTIDKELIFFSWSDFAFPISPPTLTPTRPIYFEGNLFMLILKK